MNKATNVPPGPSLKGGKNRTRRGGGGIFSSTAKVAPNTLKKYPARRELLPFNHKNSLQSERKKLNEDIMKLIDRTNLLNNSKEHDIEILQERINEIDELLSEAYNMHDGRANENAKAEVLATAFKGKDNNKNLNEYLAGLSKLSEPGQTKGGKRKSGRTRGSRKRKSSRTRRSRK
jgi:hypothetical protein